MLARNTPKTIARFFMFQSKPIHTSVLAELYARDFQQKEKASENVFLSQENCTFIWLTLHS